MFTNLYQLQAISEFELRQNQSEQNATPVFEEISLPQQSGPRLAPKVLSFKDKLKTIFRLRVLARAARTSAV